MTHTAALQTAPATGTAQTIAYRPETSVLADNALDVLLVLVLLLSGVLALTWFAKQKGWLQRWTTGAVPGAATTRGLRVEQALRLSPRTTLFRVVDGKDRYLLVESTGTVRFVSREADAAGNDS